jgi:hypothetical protein
MDYENYEEPAASFLAVVARPRRRSQPMSEPHMEYTAGRAPDCASTTASRDSGEIGIVERCERARQRFEV